MKNKTQKKNSGSRKILPYIQDLIVFKNLVPANGLSKCTTLVDLINMLNMFFKLFLLPSLDNSNFLTKVV